MYCKNCGKEIDDKAVICPFCGTQVAKLASDNDTETSAVGWGILGFVVPIVGFILFFVWKEKKPKAAKAAGLAGLISVAIYILSTFLFSSLIGNLLA